MNKVMLDETLRSKLNGLDTRLELCDESGRTLGYFLPAAEVDRSLYAWAHEQFTDEELELARRQPGGRTTAQVLDHLKNG